MGYGVVDVDQYLESPLLSFIQGYLFLKDATKVRTRLNNEDEIIRPHT